MDDDRSTVIDADPSRCYLGVTMPRATTSLKLPDALKERIADMAHGVAQTPHAYMVEAISEKVDRDEKRRAFLEAGEASLAAFKRTGTAYTHADVKRYLLDAAAGKKPRRPKPVKVSRGRR
jgi:predicted transcriptional regulator